MAQELCNEEKSLLSMLSMSSQTDLLKQVNTFITIDLIKHHLLFSSKWKRIDLQDPLA